ncbi:MAG: CHAD domain-containing protein [Verrucomicrobia bacterium]|nr:CHAD domain-containing protein [Verrucomicrobiota bacterium]
MKTPETRFESELSFVLNDPVTELPRLLRLVKKEGGIIGDPVPGTGALVDRYFDTQDWDLYNAGWSYRFRDASPLNRSVSLETLPRLADESGSGRHEGKEVELTADGGLPISSALLISEAPLSDALHEIVKNSNAGLSELFRMSTERASYRLSVDGEDILLSVDDTTVDVDESTRSAHPEHFYEVEFKLEGGEGQRLRHLAGRIEKKLGLSRSRLSKFERGLQVTGGMPSVVLLEDADDGLECGAEATVGEIARAFFLSHFRSFLLMEGTVREGGDPRAVRKMRVASRQLQVGLEVFADYLPAPMIKALRSELRWISRKLGEVRDLDVFSDFLTAEVADVELTLPELQAHVAASWAAARSALVKALTSARFLRLRRDFAAFLNSRSLWNELGGDVAALQIAENALLPALALLRKGGSAIDDASAEAKLHRLRLACKEFRYRLGLFEPLVPGGLQMFIKACKSLQNGLGVRCDVFVARGRINDFCKSNELGDVERDELKKLKKLLKGRLRDLKGGYAEKWRDFSSSVRGKKLRNRLREPAVEEARDEDGQLTQDTTEKVAELRPVDEYVIR